MPAADVEPRHRVRRMSLLGRIILAAALAVIYVGTAILVLGLSTECGGALFIVMMIAGAGAVLAGQLALHVWRRRTHEPGEVADPGEHRRDLSGREGR